MPKRHQPKYQYRCSFWSCKNSVGTDISPSNYPTCDSTHIKLMDFIEAESLEVPSHISTSGQKPTSKAADDYKVNGGNWIGA